MGSHHKRRLLCSAAITAILALGITGIATGPADATGWPVDQGNVSSSGSGYWALTYEANLHGMELGLGSCNDGTADSYLGDNYYYCSGWDYSDDGYKQIVRNNAHSIASTKCYGATTWVYANYIGDYNWVHAHKYGTLEHGVQNNENSAARGNLC